MNPGKTMKKGYFILYEKSSAEDRSGVGMKIRNQIKAFNDAGLQCGEIVLPFFPSKWKSLIYRLPFSNVYPRWVYRDEYDHADFLYMRRPYVMTAAMRKLLRKIKKRNPGIKVIIELPTFPYDAEYKFERRAYLLYLKDRYNRTRLKGLVDYFAVLEEMDSVFGLPVLKFINGIRVDDIEKRVPAVVNPNEIHMCAVAMFKEWHGYDRIIDGMKEYYANGGKRNLICHFVGTGNEVEKYRQMAEQDGLQAHFVFHGYLEGQKLAEVYNLSTLSLGVFGMYRKGLNYSCDLKSREAVARGIPSVTACPTDIFVKGQYPYFLEFPNDESTIDIEKIVAFHDGVYQDGQEKVIDEIRAYAYKTVDMQAAMKNIIEYFKS